jgi:superfamily II DNA or RNA helicase
MATLRGLLSRLDPDPIVRGRQFEHICKWFLETDPIYAPQLRRVWLWKDWPGRWGADAGIDLVAETTDAKLWAIQTKAYGPQYRITKSDVDTFLSESSREVFSYRLLMATTNHVGATALRTMEAQEKPAHLSLLSDLERASVEWPTSPRRLVGRPSKPKTPRSHQRRAIRDVVAGFEIHDRGQLVMACGTGKTLVALWLAEAMEAQRTLILVPSLSLLAQTLREWRANSTRPFEALPVCSDETVRGEDLLVAHTSDLPFPVTTDAGEIATFLRKRGPRVVFSTYQSSPRIAEAYVGGRVPGFDLAIADEAHRIAGSVAKDFGTILDIRAIPAPRRLFMTATPRYVTSAVRARAEKTETEIASMDDREKFGPVLHQLTFGEAIKRNLLSDYQVAVVAVDDEAAREHAVRGTFVTTGSGQVTDARTLAAQIGLAKAMRKWDLRRTVTFHSRVDWARRFAGSMPEVVGWMPARQRPKGTLWGDYVSGTMPSGERDVRLNRLRKLGTGERGLLSNARCLAEGVDVPTLDGVAFIDPRRSEVDVVQAVGRAIRKAEDKTIGTIVLPVFVGKSEDAEGTIETSAFDHVWQVLNALRAHDDALAEELDELRRELGRRGSVSKRPSKIHLIGPTELTPEFSKAFNVRLVERTTGSWEFWFGLLERFVQREEHARVKVGHVEDGFRLGMWVHNQRQARLDRLTPDRRTRLEALPGWEWDPFDERWEAGFEVLTTFVRREGHARVLRNHIEDGFGLGTWVYTQRSNRARDRLSDARKERLEKLPGWSWYVYSDQWDIAYERVAEYVKDHGTSRVPYAYVSPDGFPLGLWVSDKRADRSQLSPSRVTQLEALPGWTWSARGAQWEDWFARIEQFVAAKGNARVPNEFVTEDGYALGTWVEKQRGKRARLSVDQVRRLEMLPGWTWHAKKTAWDEAYATLRSFVDRTGHARVPTSYVTQDGERLGGWVQSVRATRDSLPAQRKQQLEGLPGWTWHSKDTAWDEAYARLVAYVDREGDSNVPVRYIDPDGFRLGMWASNQRLRGTQREDRKRLLENLPGWTWRQSRAHATAGRQ